MKKSYEKPQIYLERFELAEHIASGCGMIVNWQDDSCFIGVGINPTPDVCFMPDDVDESFCVYAYGNPIYTS